MPTPKKAVVLKISAFLALFALHADAQAPAPLPPEHAGAPLPRHAVTNRAFTGISSMAVAPNGRLWVTWYAGPTPEEDKNNYVVLSTSGDGGKTWKEMLTVDPDGEGPRRTFDPELWIAPDGKLRWTWTDRVMPFDNVATDTLWMIVLDDPASEATAWHPPVSIGCGVMMCKPIVLSTGEWALPVCTWFSEASSKMVVSEDSGKTFTVRGGATMPKEDRTFDEHMFVERKDGSIWCLSRTKSGIREATSTDHGKTWSPLERSVIQHPSARFFITRLISGNLLLVKHGPIDKRIRRSHLTAFISKDDGKSWEGGLVLDERSGISYPDGQQATDGTIYITHDFDRTNTRHILFSTFREEDVLAGKPISDAVRLCQLVSAGSGGQERPKPTVNANTDGVPFASDPAGALAVEGFETATLQPGAKLFVDRAYACAEVPAVLKDAQFLRIPLEGEQTLHCTRAGIVYFLTPGPERNRDSVSDALLKQGFAKVALPEVRLFDPFNVRNFGTLYQKDCAEGETITIKKWALPIFKK